MHKTLRSEKDVERYIIESERQWAESVASGDPSAVERIYPTITWAGIFAADSTIISDTHKGPNYFVSNHLSEVKVRFYRDTAIAQGTESWQRRTGERRRFVWTDTWLRRNGRWQIVAGSARGGTLA